MDGGQGRLDALHQNLHAPVRQDAERLALRGVELLLQRLEQGGEAVHELAPFRLVAGESVAEPKENGRADAT